MGYGLKININESNIDVTNNTSVVSVFVYASNTAGYSYWNANGATVTVNCNGQQSSFRINNVNCGVGETYLGSRIFTIKHDDSTGAAYVSASATFFTGVSFVGNLSASASKTLATIARASSIDSAVCSTEYVDGRYTVKFTPKNSNFYYKLRLSIPNVQSISSVSLGKGTSTSQKTIQYAFTKDEIDTIMSKASDTSENITIGLVIETFSNSNYSTKVGESAEKTINLKIPASYVPSFTNVTATGINLFGNLYLTNKSSVKLTINGAAGVAGSKIVSYSFKSDNISSSSESNTFTSDILKASGTITFTATITDSRGRNASKTCSIEVAEYTLPTLSVESFRCNSVGNRDDVNGSFISVKPTYTFSEVIGNSISTKVLKIGNTVKSTSFRSGATMIYSGYLLDNTYDLYCAITDAVGNTVSVQHSIQIASVPFNIKANKRGIAVGKYATKDETLEVAYQLELTKALKINGVEQLVVTQIEKW